MKSAGLLVLAIGLLSLPLAAHAAQYDAPVMASEVQGQSKVVAIVVAGPSGAPAGFTIQWMRFSDYLANGSQWYSTPNAMLTEASFDGIPTLNTWDGALTSFSIEPGGVAAVEIGDLYDETGVAVTSTEELSSSTRYIFRAFVNGDAGGTASPWSNNYLIDTTSNLNCTYTQGFWKNHEDAWPTFSLMLGDNVYNQTELLAILNEPARGNGLLILAHQLIATELNIAQGADASSVATAIAAAHALIGSLVIPPVGGDSVHPSTTSSLTQELDDYNNGVTGPGHCGAVSVAPSTWSSVKGRYR